MAMGFVGGIMSIIIIIISLINAVEYIKIPYYNWIGAMLLMDVIASFSAGSIVNFMLLWPLLSLTMNKENKNAK